MDTPPEVLAEVVMRVIENIPSFVLLFFMWRTQRDDFLKEKAEHDALTERYIKHLEGHDDEEPP